DIWDVSVCPSALVLMPPHEFSALRRGVTFQICGCTVIQYSPVGRPSPSPLVRHLILLVARHPFSRVVDPIGIDSGVDPAATSSGPIGGHLVKGLQRLASFWPRSIEIVILFQY